METVHVFLSTGRFQSFAEMRAFVDAAYAADGDAVPSAFMREVGLSGYEPGCIECIRHTRPIPLAELLAGASYAGQWLPYFDESRTADAAVCVFPPNQLRQPERCSLEYVGAFRYSP